MSGAFIFSTQDGFSGFSYNNLKFEEDINNKSANDICSYLFSTVTSILDKTFLDFFTF